MIEAYTTFLVVPDNIRDVLISRFEYVVAEKEVVPDLTESIRLCVTCKDWCPKQALSSVIFLYLIDRFPVLTQYHAIAARNGSTCDVSNRRWQPNLQEVTVGPVLLVRFDTRKKLTVMTFVPIPAMEESSQMPPPREAVVDQERIESLLIWRKIFLSNISTCGRSGILGNSSSFH